MTYQEMVDTMAAMNEDERRNAIRSHWQAIFSDGFIGFVQGQLEAGRKMVFSDPDFKKVFSGMDPALVAGLKRQALVQVARLAEVWDSMAAVYEELQKKSETQGNPQGMVAHGRHKAMPRGRSIGGAAHCYRCGSPAVSEGLCSGCLQTQQDWEQEDIEYDRQLYERQQQEIEYQRLQDEQLYQDNQQDFNTYTDYYTES